MEEELKLYVEDIYSGKEEMEEGGDDNEYTYIILETSNLSQNKYIERIIRENPIDTEDFDQGNKRSFLRLKFSKDISSSNLKSENWYVFKSEFFSQAKDYKPLSFENHTGSNLIRAEIVMNDSSISLLPKKKSDDQELRSLITIDELKKILNKKISDADIEYVEGVMRLSYGIEEYLYLNEKELSEISSQEDSDTLIDFLQHYDTDGVCDEYRIRKFIDAALINQIKLPDEAISLLKLKVINCGHGNWNEIHTEKYCFIYDLGASLWLKGGDIRNFAYERFAEIKKEKKEIYIIISHWDKDHYQALLTLKDETLSEVKGLIAPKPNKSKLAQGTIKRVLMKILNSLNSKVVFLKPLQGSASKPPVSILPNNKNILLYQGKGESNVNTSGVMLVAKGTKKYAILSADHDWKQLASVYCRVKNKELVIVTPHHGGNDSSRDVSQSSKRFLKAATPDCVITSCNEGNNKYGHPVKSVVQNIEELSKKHKRTDNEKLNLGEYIEIILN